MTLIQAHHAQLAGVLVAIDREERGQGELSAIQEVSRDFGCAVISIISLSDLITYLENSPEHAEYLPSVQAYRAEFG